MPGMNGLEFLDAVREYCPDIPFILFTGKGSEEIASDAVSAGVTDYVQKSSENDQYVMLANRIETAVEGYRAQQSRRAAEERYTQLVDQTLHAIAVCQDAQICYANEAFTELLNADSREEVIGLTPPEVIHPDFQDDYTDQIERIRNQQSVDWFKGKIRDFDGNSRLVETTGAPITYDDSPAVQLIFRDITDRTQREQELERTTEWFRSVFKHSHDPMLILDPEENTFQDANPRACELLGYSREELLALTPEDIHPHELDQFKTFMESVIAEGSGWTRNLSCYTKDGSTFPVEVSASVIEANGNRRVLVIPRQLDERETREQQLRQLQDATTELLTAKSQREVGRVAVDAIEEVLELPYAGFHLFDPETESLEPTVVTPGVEDIFDGDVPSLTSENDALAWETYTSGESQVIQNLERAGSELTAEMPIKSSMQFPVGDEGLLLIGAPATNAFDPTEIDLARILATTVDAVLDRLAREQEVALKNKAMDAADVGIIITDPTKADNPIIYAKRGSKNSPATPTRRYSVRTVDSSRAKILTPRQSQRLAKRLMQRSPSRSRF
ncbi:MAG: PAS domain S-box protein, partial [Halobacteriaceae archaeon]